MLHIFKTDLPKQVQPHSYSEMTRSSFCLDSICFCQQALLMIKDSGLSFEKTRHCYAGNIEVSWINASMFVFALAPHFTQENNNNPTYGFKRFQPMKNKQFLINLGPSLSLMSF